MSSHIRIGTFEFARAYASKEQFQEFIDYTIARHYRELQGEKNPTL
jgi:serine/tyrosine/threonine adenylyltransferase